MKNDNFRTFLAMNLKSQVFICVCLFSLLGHIYLRLYFIQVIIDFYLSFLYDIFIFYCTCYVFMLPTYAMCSREVGDGSDNIFFQHCRNCVKYKCIIIQKLFKLKIFVDHSIIFLHRFNLLQNQNLITTSSHHYELNVV